MNSRSHGFFLVPVLILLAGCVTPPQPPVATARPAEASTPAASYDARDSITFIHLNDSYRIDDVNGENPADDKVGGLGRVATVIEELQNEGKRVALLHGGDFLFPSLEGEVFDGQSMIAALNYLHAMAPLTVVPGNHEFDGKQSIFEKAVGAADFQWVGSNITLKTGNSSVDDELPAVHWIDVDGHKVAIFGLLLWEPDMKTYVKVEPDYVEDAKKIIAGLIGEGAAAVIALTHLVSSDDVRIAQLKKQYPQLIWVATAHEHTSGFVQGDDNQAVITRGASNARTIWKSELSFDRQGTPRISTNELFMDKSVTWHAGYEQTIAAPTRQALHAKLPFLKYVIGHAAIDMDGREEKIRTQETTLGNFITDEMKTMFPDLKVDIAFLNGGSIRIDDIIRGDITMEDIWRSFGFPTPLRYMQLEGKDFVNRVLANAVSSTDPAPGRFLQLSSGIRICINTNPKTKAKQPVLQAQVPDPDVGWRDIADDEILAVVAPGYISGGGDDYHYGEKAVIATPAAGDAKFLILGAILKATAQGKSVGKPLDPANRRIAYLPVGQDVCFH